MAGTVGQSAIEYNLLQHLHPDFYLTDEERAVNLEAEQELAKQSILYVKENPAETVEGIIDAGTLIYSPAVFASKFAIKKVGQKAASQLTKSTIKKESTKTTAENVVKGRVQKSGKNSTDTLLKPLLPKGKSKLSKTGDKKVSKKAKKGKAHKNSHDYVGESHVYKIRDLTKNKTHKVGESSAGVRLRDGKSKRAEAQVRKLERETKRKFRSKIMRSHETKKDAYKHEEKLIKRYRDFYKKIDDILPGNKGNH